jgi:hypothetical protein
MRRIWSVLLPLSLMACTENPAALRDELVLEVQQAAADQESAVVEGAQGGVVVSGVYVAPTSGYTLRAAYHAGRDGDVTLFVSGFPPDAGFGVVSGHAYRVSIPLPAGSHTVRVVHYDQRSEGPSRNVATGQVTVARG